MSTCGLRALEWTQVRALRGHHLSVHAVSHHDRFTVSTFSALTITGGCARTRELKLALLCPYAGVKLYTEASLFHLWKVRPGGDPIDSDLGARLPWPHLRSSGNLPRAKA